MDIGTAFGYPFEDEDWIVKILIGALFVFLTPMLVGIPFVLGYMVDVVRNVTGGEPRPLPEWSDLGGQFVKGLILSVVAIVYMLPVVLLACLMGSVSLIAGNGDGDAMRGAILCTYCLSSLWGLLVAAIFPAVVIRYAQTEEFSAAFRFGEIFSLIAANVGNYVVAVLLGWMASAIAGFGMLLCIIGVFPTSFWSYLVMAHLWGQVGRQAVPSDV